LLEVLLGLSSVQSHGGESQWRLLIKSYTTHDGLPDSRVAPIIQDSKGYLWFGTQAGLTRYDGKEFHTFGGAKDIPGIFGRSICEDHRGGIWFAYTGFARGGLLRYFNGAITEFPTVTATLGEAAGTIVEDGEGNIWVGSSSTLIRMRADDSTWRSWQMEVMQGLNAAALFVDREKRLWVGTFGSELYVSKNGSFTRIAGNLLPSIRPYAIYQTRNNELWVGGIFGAARIVGDAVQRFDTAHGLPRRGVWCFSEDMYGNFWVGAADGLYRLQRLGAAIRFQKERSFGDAVVYDMCLDAEGNLWLASDPGLRKLLAADFVVHFPNEHLLATQGFGPIAQQPDGTLLFGSRNAGVFALRGSRLIPGSRMQPATTFTVLSIFPESPGRTWYGMKSHVPILQHGQRSIPLRVNPSDVALSIFAIVKTSSGGVLLGSNQGLKRVVDEDSLANLSHPSLDSLVIFDIVRAGSAGEQYWLATNKGLRLIELGGDHIMRMDSFAPDGTIVYVLLLDREERLWCGTDGLGLAVFDGKTLTRYTRDDGLAGNRVLALAQDSLGCIWIGTSSGLSVFDGKSFRTFTHHEGFGEIGLHGLLADRDGFMWVSNFPGISKLQPMKFFKSTRTPPVYIADMQVDTLHLAGAEGIEIGPDPAIIAFRYQGLSFTDEANVRYRYKLEGFDRDWSPPVTQREVRYTHLGSGAYIFQVIARSADGVWSAKPATMSFTILPPLWARWWFISTSTAMLALSIYGIYRYRLAKALELERTRSRIAMDLHDDIGSSLTRISMMTEVAQRIGGSPSRELDLYLGKIGDTSRELIDALGDIVWSVDPRHDTLQDVIRRLVQFGEELCESRGITFDTVIAPELDRMQISLERRRDLYLLFKEAIANAVRHSRATRLEFSIQKARDTITIAVADNGRGFNLAQTGEGHGLKSMNERARRLGMQLHTRSQPGQGTRVALLMKTALN
jgi:signal transduction histidine kinase/ligand-binding sensor domain-containing protein